MENSNSYIKLNPYEVQLTITQKNGKKHPIYFNAADLPVIRKCRWYITAKGYPMTQGLHMAEIIHHPAPGGYVWDHLSRYKADNRRVNLKLVTIATNINNRFIEFPEHGGRYGIYPHGNDKYRTRIVGDRLKVFDTFIEALAARLEYMESKGRERLHVLFDYGFDSEDDFEFVYRLTLSTQKNPRNGKGVTESGAGENGTNII